MLFSRIYNREYLPVYSIVFVFILVNSVLIGREFFLIPLLPLLLLIAYLAFYSIDKLLILAVFLVPFSVEFSKLTGNDFGADLSLPAEPLLAIISLVVILKAFRGELIDRKILRHPVSIAIYVNLAWIFITSLTSTLPMVSFKFLISRLWFVIPFYFLAAQLFRDPGKIKLYLQASVIPLIFIIAWVLYRHIGFGITDQQASHFVVKPFYNDHTSYGAILSLIIPVLAGYYFSFSQKWTQVKRISFIALFLFFLLALVFSYTRAAWVSLAVALGVWVLIKRRAPAILITLSVLIFLFATYTYRTEIIMALETNKQTSSGNFSEHLQSIANITHDHSNLERINRWNSALRMFKEKPVFGWGPGTYMFQYAPFQLSGDKTPISTNAGTAGNAHSEYLGPLSESGVMGALSFLIIILFTFRTGLKVFFQAERKKVRIMSLAILLGLVTYYTHGIMNNFLDTDKASVLFWGFTAMLVAMDIYQRKSDAASML